ncbi:hypothetical protein ABVK25_011425 [Lepraria finkii]|uniref:Uncharacterized protein n=1 Tax=Lepraria finkii TaxID=1340010 RepID=A0ABR4AVH9_9LECA
MSPLLISQLPSGPRSSASPLHASTTQSEPSQPFRFMDLPAELRNMIYIYLLSTNHSKIEDNRNPRHPTISANLQTNDTGSDPTDQAKSRVYPLSREPSRVGHEQSRVFAESVVIMRYEGGKAFKSHTLAIELDFRYYSSIFRKKLCLSEWDEPSHFIVACEDLSQLV